VPVRPSKLWKDLPAEKRVVAADAFWRDEQGLEQQIEAVIVIARRLNFRTKSVQALPIERRAKLLAQVHDVSDTVATRALIAYHFSAERPLMAAFLDALGIEHENGVIAADDVPPPEADRLAAAISKVRAAFPADTVDLYLRTLVALDGDTWGKIDAIFPVSP
jgi:hypothetical protein